MVLGPVWRVLRFLLTVLALIALTAGSARAQDARRAGTVRLEAVSGGRGPIELTTRADPAKAGDYSAELAIVNDGKEPLVVSRIAVRGDAADPRVPAKLVARLTDGSLPITIPPGASRKAAIQWTPERGVRMRQLFGHVVVTSSDEHSGEVAMGVRAQVAGVLGPLESHVLSLLVGIPLLGAIATFLARVLGRRDDRTPYLVTVFALAIQTLLAAYVYRGFTPDVSRADGNDGLQFIEHVVWIRGLSAELYLGVDGIAATSLFVTSAVAFLAVLPERTVPRGASGYHAALLVLDAAVIGALSAMDGMLFLLFSSVAVVSAGLLVGAWGGAARRAAAMRLAVPGLFAVTLLAVALFAVARHADPTFLVDGTKVSTTFSLPELSRVALGVKGATFLGGALVKVCFVMVLLATLFLLAAFPAHGWLADVLVEAPPATGVLVATALPTIGLCAFLRIGCAVLPEGMRWASGVVVALGAISAAYGALAALGQTDLRRMAACATTSQAGFVLLGAGSLTPQGLSGAIVLGATRALACGVFLLLASAIHERARTSDASRLSGVASQMPGWGAALAAAGLAQAGVLGLGGAWGPILALLGVLSSYAPLAIVAAIGLVVIAAAHLSAVSRVAFGPLDPEWERSELLEPYGGKFPDLTAREWTSVAPLVLLVLLLGVWPAPIVAVTTGTVRDLSNQVSPPGPDQVASR
jgi:NADH-quinone oxidoreductase subunit M